MSLLTLPKTVVQSFKKDPKLLIIYSLPKVGKTSILAALENNLIIDLEQGTDYVDALKVQCNTLAEFKEASKMIIDAGRPYRYVTIDTIDKLEDWAELEATRKYKTTLQGKNFSGSSVLNLPMGAGYFLLRQEFLDLLGKLTMLAPHVILVGHLRDKMIEQGGKEVAAKDLNLTGKLNTIVCSKADAIGYLSRIKENSNLQITFATKDELACGSRCQHLKGQTFIMDSPDPAKFNWKKIYVDNIAPAPVEENQTAVNN